MNWRGITLLPILSNFLGKIRNNRIYEGAEGKLRMEQGLYSGSKETGNLCYKQNLFNFEKPLPLFIEKAFESLCKVMGFHPS